MTDPVNLRKLEHLRIIAADRDSDRQKSYFDALHLTHRALPELDLATVDPSVVVLGKRLSFPLLISSMTGGNDETLRRINHNLAAAAEATGVAMAVGSQRVMFSQPAARASFALRQHAPTALLFANLGAVQLNYGFGLDECRAAVAAVGADALYLHLNPLQEAVQPEGDTNFAGLAARLGDVAQGLGVPVVLKEVGAGLSPRDVALVLGRGIRHVDVAGTGGTSWSRIEAQRAGQPPGGSDLGLRFQDWGTPTALALVRLRPYRDQLTVFASGGVRHGLDMAKAVVLGATLCGIAQPFLAPAQESVAAVVRLIEQLRREFVTAMFLVGAGSISALQYQDNLIDYQQG